jgi:hypothetical protein
MLDNTDVLSYVLAIRAESPVSAELVDYLRSLPVFVETIVVDGSTPSPFRDLQARCGPRIRHVAPDADVRHFANGKVAGVLTGVRLASFDKVVIADDDVRYEPRSLLAMSRALDDAEVVRPQNYFDPLPWHACLDTARTLLNRVSGGDWPGTLGVRRSMLLRTNGYDGDVMFENLELVRTVVAAGGRQRAPLALYVRRLPPSTAHFWSQRVRQAYDEFARPARLMAWLAVLPLASALFAWRGPIALCAAAAATVVAAEVGRQRASGRRVFPPAASLAAPVWLLERGVCAWLAVGARIVLGGIPYRGRILKKAANSSRQLRRRYANPATAVARSHL